MNKKELGERVQKFRNAQNLNQDELGYMIGMSGASLGKIERGTNNLMLRYVPALVKALKISADDLFNLKPFVAEDNEKMGFASKSELNHLANKVDALAKSIEKLIALSTKEEKPSTKTKSKAAKKRS